MGTPPGSGRPRGNGSGRGTPPQSGRQQRKAQLVSGRHSHRNPHNLVPSNSTTIVVVPSAAGRNNDEDDPLVMV